MRCLNSQSLNKLSFGQTQLIIKLHTVQAADSGRKPLKRKATVPIKNNEGRKKKKKKNPTPVAVSVTPSESPLGHLTCKGNEYFVDWFVPSHIEPFFLKSTLVTLDLSCMEVRALGPAEVDWADNSERMLSGKVTPRQLSFHTPCLSGASEEKMQDFSIKILFVHLTKFGGKKKKKPKKTANLHELSLPCSHHTGFRERTCPALEDE